MTLTILDLVLILILFFFAFSGFFFGLIHAVGALVGTVAGVVLAANYFQVVADWLAEFIPLNDNWLRIIGFLVVFFAVNRIVAFIFWIIGKFFKVLSVLPFLKTFNRLGGLIFGLIEGCLIVGVVLVFVVKFPFAEFLIPAIEASQLAKWLFGAGTALLPLLPELFEEARTLMSF